MCVRIYVYESKMYECVSKYIKMRAKSMNVLVKIYACERRRHGCERDRIIDSLYNSTYETAKIAYTHT